MANSVNITATIQNASVNDSTALTLTQGVDMEVTVPAAADDQEVDLNMANPKVIIVLGGEGISVRLLGTTGTVLPCNDKLVLMDAEGFAQASIFVSNSSGTEKIIRVMAGG